MKVTYYGHSCFEIETRGKSILFDPFIRPNPLASHINVDNIKPNFMLVSHGHEDHIADAAYIYQQSNCTVAGVWEVMNWLQKNGVEKTHSMNTGGSWQFEFGDLKLVNAVHSSTMPDGSSGGNPVGFVISNSEDIFYFAGDTALYSDMALISKRFKLKTAFLPIGSNFTMDVKDAISAAKLLQCTTVIGMHYDTFGYIKINHTEAKSMFHDAGIELVLMEIGQTTII